LGNFVCKPNKNALKKTTEVENKKKKFLGLPIPFFSGKKLCEDAKHKMKALLI
jgi:hypothetical protein